MATTMQYKGEYCNLPKCINIQYYQLCGKCMTYGQPCLETDLSNKIFNFKWYPDSYIKKCKYKIYSYCLLQGYCLFCTSRISQNSCSFGSFTHSQTRIS